MNENEENENITFEAFSDLNETFYEMFGRLAENREFLPDYATAYVGQKLFEQYKAEYEILAARKLIPDKQELYRLNAEGSLLIPRKIWLLFKNRCAKMTLQEVAAEVGQMFKDRQFAFDAAFPGLRKKTRAEKRKERKAAKERRRREKAERKQCRKLRIKRLPDNTERKAEKETWKKTRCAAAK